MQQTTFINTAIGLPTYYFEGPRLATPSFLPDSLAAIPVLGEEISILNAYSCSARNESRLDTFTNWTTVANSWVYKDYKGKESRAKFIWNAFCTSSRKIDGGERRLSTIQGVSWLKYVTFCATFPLRREFALSLRFCIWIPLKDNK